MGDTVFDVEVATGCAPTAELPEFVMTGAGDAVVGAGCAGACCWFVIDGAVTAGKPLERAVWLTEGT